MNKSIKQLGFEVAAKHNIPPESLNSITVAAVNGGSILLGFADMRPHMGYYQGYTCAGKPAGHAISLDELGKRLFKHHSSELLIEA